MADRRGRIKVSRKVHRPKLRMVMPEPMNTRPTRSARHAQRSERGQTLVEVGLMLPIFLLTLLAVIEFGWYTAVSAATSSASREAARYGSTVGDPGDPHYVDCDGILAAAQETTESLISLDGSNVEITYEDETLTPIALKTCATMTEAELERWYRVVVEVTVEYEPLVPLLRPIIGTHDLVSIDRRSIGCKGEPTCGS
jgi:hypothetical protein